ncbi:TPR repeat-containing protein [Synechococcus sp. PROS-7-1]|uniref:tetratricopeptide repeat-containing glycosyltransferase family protein n=1 Tax=Synechococcus sp. PROS-7-1 TaxID=1442556 RepID=UPI0016453BEF|nr:tetratricopeptide repeat-containing glycosyltransferase family protein [Synechococcus sp. PROS-7-1]QNI83972.1 TPR repeat-containing protein [Synechococcus sp. PROS-7-1]
MGPGDCLLALSEGSLKAETALNQARAELDQEHASAEWAVVASAALWMLKRFQEGYELHRSFSSHLQNDGNAWLIAGLCARKLANHHQEAEQALLRATSLLPERSDAHYNLGNHYSDLDQYDKAVLAYERSLALDANGAQVWHNYGIALRERDRLDEAEMALQNSLQLDPCNADVWCNFGLIAHAREHFDLAKRCYLQSIQVDQHHAEGWVNVGMALLEELKPEEALEALQRGSALDPSSPEAVFNMALTLLLLGDYDEGWRLYETRFTTKQFSGKQPPCSGPWVLTMEQLQALAREQRRCLVWTEQGLGDVIQFLRYLPILQALGVSFVFATRRTLIPLVQEWGPPGLTVCDDTALDEDLKTAPHLALLSLPRLLRTTLSTIPSATPYLRPPGPPPAQLLVPAPPGGIAVGLVWASNPGNKAMYRQKSLPLKLLLPRLLPALSNDLIELHSLQVGSDADELAPYQHLEGLVDWNGRLDHFGDTAHVVSQLDLVISVDTAVAHLAAALDLPTWVLLPNNADFRWLRDRSDSPWYSSMRLFRQPKRHDWSSAIDGVVDALGEVLGLDLNALAQEVR